MIKTHKPRGYIWTNASAFQHTKEFRDISYDESAAPTSKDVLLQPEQRFSDAEHGRKRRRIEKLADDFLNGQPLFISSARPCPSSLKSTITWNERSSTQSKFTLPKVDIPHGSTTVWQDMEDDEEILRRHCSLNGQPQAQTKSGDGDIQLISKDGNRVQSIMEAVPRVATRRRPALSTRPSEEALKQAAALRARRAQTAKREAEPVPVESGGH